MALQFSTAYRNAALNAFETVAGESEVIKIWSGTLPANCAAADAGTMLVQWNLASSSDWTVASTGSKTLSGLPLQINPTAAGTAAFFRIYASGATTCHMQGTVGASGSGADMIIGSITITMGVPVTIQTATLTFPGA
jgi:hypothetical protein